MKGPCETLHQIAFRMARYRSILHLRRLLAYRDCIENPLAHTPLDGMARAADAATGTKHRFCFGVTFTVGSVVVVVETRTVGCRASPPCQTGTSPKSMEYSKASKVLTVRTFVMRKHFPGHLFGMLAAVSAFCSTLAAPSSNVVMTFVHPERFTDFRVQDRNEWDSAAWFTRNMTEDLAPTVAQQAPGCTLAFRFTDIDLGRPLQRDRSNHVRFYSNGREPIRLYFDYTVTDPRGRVIASGSDSATDALYLGKYTSEPARSSFEEFYFEKQTLIYWIKAKIHVPQGGRKLRG